jgi:hypothetical protein
MKGGFVDTAQETRKHMETAAGNTLRVCSFGAAVAVGVAVTSGHLPHLFMILPLVVMAVSSVANVYGACYAC